jgi:RND superfamily putative drug exporter
MFAGLGRFIVRRKKSVLIVFIVGILAAGGIGSLSFSKLDSGGYSDLNSDSAKAYEYLTDKFKVQEPGAILVIDTGERTVNDPAVVAEAAALEAKVKTVSGVDRTLSYWTTGGAPSMKAADDKAAFLFIFSEPESNDWAALEKIGKEVQAKFDGKQGNFTVHASGAGVITHAINNKIKEDLFLAEAIAIPLTFILLIFVFGAMVASAMPLVVGISAILGSFLIIYVLTLFTDVSVFALNLITGLGLGLGIDYALLIVNRFREELHSGKSVDESVVITVATAGKTVFYSGLTVFVTMASLLFFPLNFLKSFGYAGVAVISLAVVGALIPLPALLAILGHKIDKGVIRKAGIVPSEDGRWARTARTVMKRPVPVVIGSLLVLGVLAAPITNIAFAQVDARVLPKSDPAAVASVVIEERFTGLEGSPIEVVIPNGKGKEIEINNFLARVQGVYGISRVGQLEYFGNDVRVQVISSEQTRTLDAQRIIHEIRDLPVPEGTLIALTVFILIFVFTGSIILPIKAVLLNAMSLVATLGAVTWIFIDGNLKWLVGDFTVTGTLDTGSVILVAVVVFGLSMDYELFLLSRIREEHLEGKSNVESVAKGLQRSARIITAAALLLAVVFAAFMTSGVTSIKMLGFGVAFAVLLDATLVRALLVPALMRLFGERNWWAPKSLQRFTLRH